MSQFDAVQKNIPSSRGSGGKYLDIWKFTHLTKNTIMQRKSSPEILKFSKKLQKGTSVRDCLKFKTAILLTFYFV